MPGWRMSSFGKGARLRLGLLLAALAAGAVFAPAAGAHAVLERSSPSSGARLASPPDELRLTFSEEISARFRFVRVLDEAGHAVPGTRVRGDGTTLAVELPRLEKGTYGVIWRVVSEDDAHATGGSFAFGVGRQPGAASFGAAETGAAVSGSEVLLRWFDFSFLAVILGALLVGGVVLPRPRPTEGLNPRALAIGRRRVLRAGAWFALLASVCGLGRLFHEASQLSVTLPGGSSTFGSLPDVLFDTRWGAMWLVREVALVAVAVLLLSLTFRRVTSTMSARGRLGAAVVLLVVVGTAHAMTSHAAALQPFSASAVAADTMHVLAAGAWLGGVAAFALALWPTGGLGRQDALALMRACRRSFAELAAVSVGVVFATGLYSAGRQVASVDALLTTGYGHVLLVKVGIVLGAAALGGANFLLLRRLARRRGGLWGGRAGSRWLLIAEVVMGAGVFLAAAVLSASVPARGAQFSAPQPAITTVRSGSAADLVVSVSATPTRAGNSTFTAVVASSRRPPPAPIAAVLLELRGPKSQAETVPLQKFEPGRYFGTAFLSDPGRWKFAVTVRRAGETITVPFTWSVAPADPARPVRFSARPLAPILDWASALLFALALSGAVWIIAGKPRPAVGRRRTPVAEPMGDGVG